MPRDDEETCELDGIEFVTETDEAVLIKCDGDSHWIPKSQIIDQDVYKKGDVGSMTITAWLAKKKGML